MARNIPPDLAGHEAVELGAGVTQQRFDGKLVTGGVTSATLAYRRVVNQGNYGLIQEATRHGTDGSSRLVAVKRPREAGGELLWEAILQKRVSRVLTEHGFAGACPNVYDVFQYGGEDRFTMDWIPGMSVGRYLQEGVNPEAVTPTFLNLVSQLAMILLVLQRELRMDHRDMSPNNLWVRPLATPRVYTLDCPGLPRLELPISVQLVLLDFGSACLGTPDSTSSAVNLAAPAIPDLDPCPKEGRDLYHILNQLLAMPGIRRWMGRDVLQWFSAACEPYGVLRSPGLAMATTSDPAFRVTALTPAAFLRWAYTQEGGPAAAPSSSKLGGTPSGSNGSATSSSKG